MKVGVVPAAALCLIGVLPPAVGQAPKAPAPNLLNIGSPEVHNLLYCSEVMQTQGTELTDKITAALLLASAGKLLVNEQPNTTNDTVNGAAQAWAAVADKDIAAGKPQITLATCRTYN